MLGAFQCGEILTGVFDHYVKSGQVNISQINNRQLPVIFPNISKMVNDASIPSIMGNTYKLDKNGDLVLDITARIYKYNVSYSGSINQPLQPIIVGKWSVDSGILSLNESSVFFLGNRSAPPMKSQPTGPIYTDYNYNYFGRAVIDLITSLCCLITVIILLLLIRFIKTNIIKASSPPFLFIILFGANLSFSSIFVLSLFPMVFIF
jgi:hypothetical protein